MSFIDNIIQYITDGTVSRGSFKWYLLTGNLFEAVRHADDYNIDRLPELVQWLWMHAPCGCYGDEDNVCNWIEVGGMIGKHGVAYTAAWKSTVKG